LGPTSASVGDLPPEAFAGCGSQFLVVDGLKVHVMQVREMHKTVGCFRRVGAMKGWVL